MRRKWPIHCPLQFRLTLLSEAKLRVKNRYFRYLNAQYTYSSIAAKRQFRPTPPTSPTSPTCFSTSANLSLSPQGLNKGNFKTNLKFLTEKKLTTHFEIGQKSILATWQYILKATQESITALILNGDPK